MWLGLTKVVDIYLGQTLALVNVPGKDIVVSEYPITLPVDKLLDRLTETVPRRSRVRVALSCGHCPAVELSLPIGLKTWHEREALAKAWTAGQLQLEPSALACELDERHPAVAAALPASTLEAIQNWAGRANLQVVSVRPLWSCATEWFGKVKSGKRGLSLREPDGTTLLVETKEFGMRARATSGGDDGQATEVELHNWLVQFSIRTDEVLALGFGRSGQGHIANGPRHWEGHWSLA